MVLCNYGLTGWKHLAFKLCNLISQSHEEHRKTSTLALKNLYAILVPSEYHYKALLHGKTLLICFELAKTWEELLRLFSLGLHSNQEGFSCLGFVIIFMIQRHVRDKELLWMDGWMDGREDVDLEGSAMQICHHSVNWEVIGGWENYLKLPRWNFRLSGCFQWPLSIVSGELHVATLFLIVLSLDCYIIEVR